MDNLDNLIAQLKQAGVDTAAFTAELNKVRAGQADANKLAATMESTLRGIRAEARGLSGDFGGIRDSLTAALAELAKTDSAVSRGTKNYRSLTAQVNQLAQEEEGIVTLSVKQLNQSKQKAAASLSEIKLAAKRLAIEKGIGNIATENLSKVKGEAGALLRAYQEGFRQEEIALANIESRLEKEKLVTKQIGLTGAALSGAGKILDKLGLGGLSSEIESVSTSIRTDMRKELEKNKKIIISSFDSEGNLNQKIIDQYHSRGKNLDRTLEEIKLLEDKEKLNRDELKRLEDLKGKKTRILASQEEMVSSGQVMVDVQYQQVTLAKKLGVAFSGATQILSKGLDKLKDPAVIFGFIGKSLLAGNSQAVNLQKNLTISASAARGLRTELAGAAIASGSNFITTDKMIKSYVELTKYIGQSAHILGNEALKSATYLTEKLHLSADAAGQLVTMTRLTGRNTEETFNNMGDTLTQFNLTNKTAFSLKDIMEDVGNISKATVLTLSKSPDALIKAAAAARKLGVSMAQLESIGESLLDFQSSIEAELEAQLLTGNALNLNRARELAMMGDMEGLAKEVGKQEAIKNAFATKNVIAQKAAAKALGMSREELAAMTYKQELATLGAEKFKKEYGEVAYQSAKAQSAQDKFADLLTKSKDILANLLTPLLPIVELIGKAAAMPLAAPILAAVIAMKALGGSIGSTIKGAGTLVGKMSKLGKDGVGKTIKDKAVGLKDKVLGKFKAGRDGLAGKNPLTKPMDKGAEMTGKMQKKTKGAKDGKGVKSFLTGLGDGLAAIGQKFGKVIQGAIALGIAGVAIGGSFAIALKLVKDVDPIQMLAFSTSIGIFGGALALLGNMASQVIKGSVAMGILSLAAIGFAAAFSMLENVDTNKMIAFSIAVPLLGLAAAGLGLIAPFIFAGALAIGALGLSLIPLAGAFALLGAVNVEGILGQLGSFASIAPGLLVAGAGLLGLSAGLIAFSAAMTGASILGGLTSLFGGGVMGDLQALTAMAEPLSQVGVSLTAIAAGISGIALALSTLETAKIDELKGLVMTTAMAAPMVAASGAITDLIAGITGQTQEGNSNATLEAKLDELIAAVKQGGDVFIDGNKAGNAVMLASYKTA